MDFGLLPPEVNSARMYAGPGSGPWITAALAWDALAAQLHVAAASYESVISELALAWRGPSSAAMVAAAAPYQAWMTSTAGQAERTAAQARAATAAYESAFATTVAPAAIAANRTLQMSLIATNLFGQNTAAIAATDAQYAEMWAQDSTAMYVYAASSSAASQLTPFSAPRHGTESAGSTGHTAAVGHATAAASGANAQALPQSMAGAPQTLQGLATPSATAVDAAPSATPSLSEFLVGPYNPLKLYEPFGGNFDFSFQNVLADLNRQNLQLAYEGAVTRSAAGMGPAVTYSGGQPVAAGFGGSASVGNLTVPTSWVEAAPAVRPIAFTVPQANPSAAVAALTAEDQGSVFSNVGLSGLTGRALRGVDGAAGRSVGGMGGGVVGKATSATIIVIPEDD